jgi:hypothetical protein
VFVHLRIEYACSSPGHEGSPRRSGVGVEFVRVRMKHSRENEASSKHQARAHDGTHRRRAPQAKMRQGPPLALEGLGESGRLPTRGFTSLRRFAGLLLLVLVLASLECCVNAPHGPDAWRQGIAHWVLRQPCDALPLPQSTMAKLAALPRPSAMAEAQESAHGYSRSRSGSGSGKR